MSELRRTRLAHGAEVLAAKLAEPQQRQQDCDCDVLVVGSGYGGAVAAARLAGATVPGQAGGQRRPATVWVLERGLEHRPGSFPSRFGDVPGEVRFSRQDGRPARGQPEGLFDLRLGDDVHVLLGNGLGGGSLINAGVMERPLATVFDSGWPAGLNLTDAGLAEGYRRAETMLAPTRLPESADVAPPAKLRALRALAQGNGVPPQDPTRPFSCNIAVSFDANPSVAGVAMAACTRCGDCITGCNQGAKRTLDTNYLAWAWRAGAEMFCGGWVERLEHDAANKHWLVHWHYTATGRRPPGGDALRLRARQVVLAAGSLGSTEILLRSSARLSLSPRLGRGFSTNGDQVVAAFRQKDPVQASRDEDDDPGEPSLIGPTICGLVRETCGAGPIAVEEFAVPAALKRVMGEVTTTFGLLQSMFEGPPARHPADVASGDDELAVSRASLEHTSILGIMGNDHALGEMTLAPRQGGQAADAELRLHWPRNDDTLGQLFDAQRVWIQDACAGLPAGSGPGGTVVPNPTWSLLPTGLQMALDAPAGSASTVHPLGGCAMADSVEAGVVDRAGRVYDPAGGVHEGLAVLDGAIVPTALAINPALTIAALAEQAIPQLAEGWGLDLAAVDTPGARALPAGDDLPEGWQPALVPAATDFRVREQMNGALRIGGKRYWAELEVPSLDIGDLAKVLRSRQRELPLVGEMGAPCLKLYGGGVGTPPDATLTLSGRLRLFEPYTLSAAEASAAKADALIVALERLRSRQQTASATQGAPQDWLEAVAPLLGLLETLGQGRRLVYTMTVEGLAGQALPGLERGTTITGTKTIVFGERANPWQQLMEMEVELHPRPADPAQPLGRLRSDLGYFAQWRELLGSLTAQRDHPSALADLAGLVLLAARILMFTHWPHFIPPGDMRQKIGERLPGPLDGMDPVPHPVGGDGALLLRYPAAAAAAAGAGNPLLLIHGLSAAGSTFAHPSIPDNLVRFMHRQGRDVWVLELRTSSARHPRPPQAYRFEDVATADIPQAIDKIIKETRQGKVDVVAHCIGAAMFCMALLHRDQRLLHTRIGRAVLSQVGPYATMSPFNRFRGYAAGFLEDYLGLDELDVRPDHAWDEAQHEWLPDKTGGSARLLLDALLASYPYPDDDQEVARVATLAHRHGPNTDFRRVRHRADAIIGQTLQLENVGDDTLLALDAIYGWVRSRTLAQTIHIARQGVLTSADGINDSVSGVGLARRFDFPVLLLHGERNEVFDWRGSLRSYGALKRAWGEAPGQHLAVGGDRHWGAGTPRQLRLLRRYGHQDTLIGKDVGHEVFPCVEQFLTEAFTGAAAVPAQSRFACEVPWLGPLQGWLRATAGGFELAVLVHAGARRALPCCVVLVPVPGGAAAWPSDATAARGYTLGPGPQRQALLEQALQLQFVADAAALPLHYAVLLLYREQQDDEEGADDFKSGTAPAADPLQGGFALSAPAQAEVARFLRDWGSARSDLLLTIDPRTVAARDLSTPTASATSLTFALGSCQFPPALFDKVIAGNACRQLGRELDAADAPQFQLLLGDLVYLDALGNVFESPGRDAVEIARRAYEAGWRLRPFRLLALRLPMYTMLDDHEVENDWQPAADGAATAEQQAALLAYEQHQAKLAPPSLGHGSYSYCFAPGGVPFFVLDTRTRRQARHAAGGVPDLTRAHIVDGADMAALHEWLLANRDAPVKFIASPSFVLPVERPELSGPERLRLDGWSGYPASQCELLGFIDRARIRGVVFLGGDAHLSAVSTFTFNGSGHRVVSIVSSGLYTPWPFINARPEELRLRGPVHIDCGSSSIDGQSTLEGISTQAGFAIVRVQPQGDGSVRLRVELRPTAGPTPQPVELLL